MMVLRFRALQETQTSLWKSGFPPQGSILKELVGLEI